MLVSLYLFILQENNLSVVCVHVSGVLSCWSVTYTPKSICALNGSSVEFHSYYTYPEDNTVTKALWFIEGHWPPGQEPKDLIQEDHYHGRVNYTEKNTNNHTLRITDLITGDSNNFRFRFITDKEGRKFSGGNVELSVTGNLHDYS